MVKNTRFGKVAAVGRILRLRRADSEARPCVAGVRQFYEQVSVAHVFPRGEDVDGRDKHGYDGERGSRQRDIIACMIERER